VGGDAHLVAPDGKGIVVFAEHAHHQAVGGQLEHFRRQFPGPGDRLLFEIVAKAEVAQHLKERVVPRRAAHVLNVVGANALLEVVARSTSAAGAGPEKSA
jgi:hypothetical protein